MPDRIKRALLRQGFPARAKLGRLASLAGLCALIISATLLTLLKATTQTSVSTAGATPIMRRWRLRTTKGRRQPVWRTAAAGVECRRYPYREAAPIAAIARESSRARQRRWTSIALPRKPSTGSPPV